MKDAYLLNIYDIIGCGLLNCLFPLYLTSYKEVKNTFGTEKTSKKHHSKKKISQSILFHIL